MGLVSDGGVHSHVGHLVTLLDFAALHRVPTVVHAFLDGRDTPPRSGLGYVRELAPHVERAGARFGTVMGRYFAMDRDRRWDRIEAAYRAIVSQEGERAPDAVTAVQAAYDRGESDEFVKPTVVEGAPALGDGDAVVFFNFRADRARQLTNAITDVRPETFSGELQRERVVRLSSFVCFTEYDAEFDLPVAFPNEQPRRILGEIVADCELTQLRIAETEKYAHVTFFFNGGLETPYPGEDRALIASPRDVATYDHKPEMSAHQVTDEAVRRIAENDYGFILLNYANPDMLGHTGILDAAVKAVETIDHGLERIVDSVLACDGSVLITADHGNCELMVDPETGQAHTAHTTNPVPVIWIGRESKGRALRDGGLADLAPTVLALIGLPVPEEMTGESLILDA